MCHQFSFDTAHGTLYRSHIPVIVFRCSKCVRPDGNSQNSGPTASWHGGGLRVIGMSELQPLVRMAAHVDISVLAGL